MEAPGNGLLVMVNVGLGKEYVPSCKATEIDPILFATCMILDTCLINLMKNCNHLKGNCGFVNGLMSSIRYRDQSIDH